MKDTGTVSGLLPLPLPPLLLLLLLPLPPPPPPLLLLLPHPPLAVRPGTSQLWNNYAGASLRGKMLVVAAGWNLTREAGVWVRKG